MNYILKQIFITKKKVKNHKFYFFYRERNRHSEVDNLPPLSHGVHDGARTTGMRTPGLPTLPPMLFPLPPRKLSLIV